MKFFPTNSAALIVLAIWATSQAQAPSQGKSKMPSPYQNLESAARLADAAKPASIDELTHEVVSFPHLFPVPPPLSDILEDRLSRSETAYRNKLGPGVSEAQLVDLMNSFAVKFRLPDYAKTTPAQIRFLRMGLALQSPAFMGSGLAVQGMRVGDSVSTEMSPLQAMHLFEIMIDQKIINPVFQDPLSDPLLLNEERRKKIDELRRASSTTTPGFGLLTGNTKISEMRSAISTGIESMSISDAYDLLDHTFNTMRLR